MNFLERGSNPPSHTYGLAGGKYAYFYDYINRMAVGHTLDIVYHKRKNLLKFRNALRQVLSRNEKYLTVKTKIVLDKKKGLILRITKTR